MLSRLEELQLDLSKLEQKLDEMLHSKEHEELKSQTQKAWEQAIHIHRDMVFKMSQCQEELRLKLGFRCLKNGNLRIDTDKWYPVLESLIGISAKDLAPGITDLWSYDIPPFQWALLKMEEEFIREHPEIKAWDEKIKLASKHAHELEEIYSRVRHAPQKLQEKITSFEKEIATIKMARRKQRDSDEIRMMMPQNKFVKAIEMVQRLKVKREDSGNLIIMIREDEP